MFTAKDATKSSTAHFSLTFSCFWKSYFLSAVFIFLLLVLLVFSRVILPIFAIYLVVLMRGKNKYCIHKIKRTSTLKINLTWLKMGCVCVCAWLYIAFKMLKIEYVHITGIRNLTLFRWLYFLDTVLIYCYKIGAMIQKQRLLYPVVRYKLSSASNSMIIRLLFILSICEAVYGILFVYYVL